MTATWRLHAVPDRLPARLSAMTPLPLRPWCRTALALGARLQQSAIAWLLTIAGGIVLLAALVQAGVRLEQQALLQQRLGPVLGVSVSLHDAAGQRVGDLVAQPDPAAAAPALPPGALWLALGLPLLALAVALRAEWDHAAAGSAVRPRWGLAFAVLSLAAGLLLAGAAGRLQGPLEQTAADPARRTAVALALRVGQALDAGVPLQRLAGLNPLLRQRLREAPGVAEIRVVDADHRLLAVQAGPALADPRLPVEVAPVMHRGERVAQVQVQRAALRTPWLLLNLLGVACALVAVGLLLIGQDLRLRTPTRQQRPLTDSMAGVLTGAAVALTGAVLVRSDAALALAALAGPALLMLAACVVWRWGRAMAAPRLLAGALAATAWCLVQG